MSRLIGAAILVISLSGGWFWMSYRTALDSTVNLQESLLFEIQPGDSVGQVGERLRMKGIIRSPFWFRLHARLQSNAHRIKVGEYRLLPEMTLRQMLALFVAGKVTRYSLTLPEGITFAEMLALIAQEPALSHSLAGQDHAAILAAIGASESHPEGLFFPDTYFFPKGTRDQFILKRAYAKMQKVLQAAWAERADKLPLKSAYEALILASIVEKETGQASERPLIAGVFIRRLQKGMRLQTDPTVIYGMGASYRGNIRRRDLRRDTPYNTYVHEGLPPTPIAMPGAAAIQAVLHPAAGNSLYFVARGDGSHVFSNTLKEHNRAVDIFQRKRAAR